MNGELYTCVTNQRHSWMIVSEELCSFVRPNYINCCETARNVGPANF